MRQVQELNRRPPVPQKGNLDLDLIISTKRLNNDDLIDIVDEVVNLFLKARDSYEQDDRSSILDTH